MACSLGEPGAEVGAGVGCILRQYKVDFDSRWCRWGSWLRFKSKLDRSSHLGACHGLVTPCHAQPTLLGVVPQLDGDLTRSSSLTRAIDR
jgi:hypothetical protein